MAKRLRKLTIDMKKLLSKKELNPNDFGLVTQNTKCFMVQNIKTGEVITFAK